MIIWCSQLCHTGTLQWGRGAKRDIVCVCVCVVVVIVAVVAVVVIATVMADTLHTIT